MLCDLLLARLSQKQQQQQQQQQLKKINVVILYDQGVSEQIKRVLGQYEASAALTLLSDQCTKCISHPFDFSANLKNKQTNNQTNKYKQKNTFTNEFFNEIWFILGDYEYINIAEIKKKKTFFPASPKMIIYANSQENEEKKHIHEGDNYK